MPWNGPETAASISAIGTVLQKDRLTTYPTLTHSMAVVFSEKSLRFVSWVPTALPRHRASMAPTRDGGRAFASSAAYHKSKTARAHQRRYIHHEETRPTPLHAVVKILNETRRGALVLCGFSTSFGHVVKHSVR